MCYSIVWHLQGLRSYLLSCPFGGGVEKGTATTIGRPTAEEAAAERHGAISLAHRCVQPPCRIAASSWGASDDTLRVTAIWEAPVACTTSGWPQQLPARVTPGQWLQLPIRATRQVRRPAVSGECQPSQLIPAGTQAPPPLDPQGLPNTLNTGVGL